MKNKFKKGEFSSQEAKALLVKEQQARVDRCREKINQVLDEEQCLLDCQMIISVRGVTPQVNILPKNET